MLHLYQAKSFLPANPLSDMYVCFFRELFKTVSVTDEDMARVLSKLKFIKSKRQLMNLKRILCSSTITRQLKQYLNVETCCGTGPFWEVDFN